MSVACQFEDGVALITVDDGKANAYSHELLDELGSALDAAEKEAAPVVVAGRPGRFSAGFSLPTMTAGAESMRGLVRHGTDTLMRLFTFPGPVVMACTGHALAFGALMLLVGDHRVGAAGDYRIGLNEVAIGMPLPIMATELARYRLAASRLDAILLGETGGPDTAVASGYLDRVVAPESVVAEAGVTARAAAGLSRAAVGRSKQALRGPVVSRILETVDEDLGTLAAPPPR